MKTLSLIFTLPYIIVVSLIYLICLLAGKDIGKYLLTSFEQSKTLILIASGLMWMIPLILIF